MTRTTIKQIALTTLLASLAGAAGLAQQVAPGGWPDIVIPYTDANAPDARYIIFSNLDSTPGDRFDPSLAFTVAGRSASGETETWQAVRFKPEVDVQAKVLMAAIGYAFGTKLVNLGIYSNNEITGSVGDPLPGGQGSTTQIPDNGTCCQLAKVTLPGVGVTLAAQTYYWLVAGPDNINAPTFKGSWRLSNLAASANFSPSSGWRYPTGQWPAAEIRGTRLQGLGPTSVVNREVRSSSGDAPASNVTIFTNLDRNADALLYLYGAGALVAGNEVPFQPEAWQALPFTPKVNVHVTTLAAAIASVSGTKLVNLGIYSDNDGEVGTPLPGGQGSTRQIPDLGDCCELTKVRLPGAGIALGADVQYWLVASPDNQNAPDFHGAWQESSLAVRAYQEPENFINWTSLSGDWFAAEIRGTEP